MLLYILLHLWFLVFELIYCLVHTAMSSRAACGLCHCSARFSVVCWKWSLA